MNLDSVFDEPIVDQSWYQDGLIHPGEPTFDPEAAGVKNPNNTRPELAIEWGTAGPNIDFDDPAGAVKRHIPEDDLEGVDDVILFARDQMNRGRTGADLNRALRTRFDQGSLKRASKGLREQFSLEGIVGCVVLDARGYGSCRDAMEASKSSPYKHFIKHVIGCDCGSPQMFHADGIIDMSRIMEGSDNPMDDFLAMEGPEPADMVSHCRSTLLPILSGEGDIQESDMDSTLTELMNVTGLPEDTVKSLREDRHNNKYVSNLKAVQAAFRSVQKVAQKSNVSAYSGKVDVSDHIVESADQPIEFDAQASSPFDMDLVDPNRQSIVDINVLRQPSLSIEKISGEFGDIDMVDVLEASPSLNIDERPAEQQVELVAQSPVDVEIGQFLEPEFLGTDNVELDEPKTHLGELEIDMRQDMRI